MLVVSQLLRVARGEPAPEGRGPSRLRFGRADAEAPPVVVWNACRHCNMTCPHCYAAAGGAPSRFDLTTERARAVIDELAEAGVKIVIWSGGEPLLREDLPELVRHARARGLQCQLSTNGTLLVPAVVEDLKALGVSYVGVSVDGPREWNDAYRGLPGGFDRAVEGLRLCRAAGLPTGVRMTVTSGNAAFVRDVLEVARDVGARRFYVSHLVPAGRGVSMAGADLQPHETRVLLLDLFERAEALLDVPGAPDVVTGSNDSDGPLLLRWVADRHGAAAARRVESFLRARGGNTAGEKVLNVDARGRVHPDQFWQGAVLADLTREPFGAALAHPLRVQLARREELLRGRCGACGFRDVCRGSHRERALAATGDAWAPDPACVMTDAEILVQPADPFSVVEEVIA
jgi:radical SAM protein with 4Fe4S-binding SPASM domain